MSELVTITTPDGGRLVVDATYPSTPAGPSGNGLASRGLGSDKPAEIVRDLGEALHQALGPLQELLGALTHLAEGVDEVEVAFTLGVSAAAGFVVSKVGVDANFAVTLHWKQAPRPAAP